MESYDIDLKLASLILRCDFEFSILKEVGRVSTIGLFLISDLKFQISELRVSQIL